jgi:hypothetical protein
VCATSNSSRYLELVEEDLELVDGVVAEAQLLRRAQVQRAQRVDVHLGTLHYNTLV